MRLILASASPRRRELLAKVTEGFEILVARTDESLDVGIHPRDGVRILAERKGEAVYRNIGSPSDTIIISSDTLVELNGIPLGKPISDADAHRMLRSLSGKRHNVHTGISVRVGDKLASGVATTGVYFRELSDEQIDEYISTGECSDKAGSYAIQGGAGKFVERIEGDFDTVVGFSIRLLRELFASLSIEGVLTEE